MNKHAFVTGVMALGFALLAGAHASATARIDTGRTTVSAQQGIVVARGGQAEDNGVDRRRGARGVEDNNNQRRNGRS